MIDTHVHHFDLEQFRYPWLDDPEFGSLRGDYLPTDYRAEDANTQLDGWVHVQAEVDHGIDPVRENHVAGRAWLLTPPTCRRWSNIWACRTQ